MMPDMSFATNSAMVSNVFGAYPVVLYKFLARIKVISVNAVLLKSAVCSGWLNHSVAFQYQYL